MRTGEKKFVAITLIIIFRDFFCALVSHIHIQDRRKYKNCAVSYGICVTKTVIREFLFLRLYSYFLPRSHNKRFPYFGAFCLNDLSVLTFGQWINCNWKPFSVFVSKLYKKK